MLFYDISPEVEAFSTERTDNCDFEVLLPLHQAHTALVRRIPQEKDEITGVDALITNELDLRIGVKTADCVPILLFDKRNKAVAAVHSGWRGTAKNIIRETLDRMGMEFGTRGEDIKAIIGPCIHLGAFEVGPEVVKAFTKETRPEEFPFAALLPHPETRAVKWHMGLTAICRRQLLDCGVSGADIEVRSECSWSQHQRFFSARRLGNEFDRQRTYSCIKLIP